MSKNKAQGKYLLGFVTSIYELGKFLPQQKMTPN